MRRVLGFALVAIAVIALLWSGAWIYGRGRVDDALSERAEALRARGFGIEIGERSIGGFPLGYEVALSDLRVDPPGSGPVVRLAAIVARVDLRTRDRLELAVPGTVVLSRPGEGGADLLEIEPEGLEIALEGFPGDAERLTVAADTLLLVRAPATGEAAEAPSDPKLAVDLVDLDLALERPAAGSPGRPTLEIRLGRLDYAFAAEEAGPDPDAPPAGLGLEGSLGPVVATGTATARDMCGLDAILAGAATGEARLSLTAGRADARVTRTGLGPGRDGTADIDLGTLGARIAVADGSVEARGSALTGTLALADPDGTPRGQIAAGPVEARYRMPLAPSDSFAPMGVSLSLARAMPDDVLWREIDPEGALPREGLDLELQIDATGRLTGPLGDRRPGEAFPVELGNVMIERAELNLLGARASAEGAVEFLPTVQQPTGAITLTLEGVLGLIRGLNGSGLLPQEQVQVLATLLALYTRPAGDGPDRLTSEIAFDAGTVTVNGTTPR